VAASAEQRAPPSLVVALRDRPSSSANLNA
jgi:hypothetical protein